MKIVEHFILKKKLLGGYKVAYKCPHCFEPLTSQESEIIDEEECPECGGVFRVAESALTTIESLKLQSGDQTNLSEVAINKNSGLSFDDENKTSQETEFTLNFMNQVPSDEVQEIESKYDGQRITAKYKILKDGSYVFVGGKIGCKDSKGQDTFESDSCTAQWQSGLKGEIVTVDIQVEITEGYWAIGVFKNISDIPVSSESKQNTNRVNYSTKRKSELSASSIESITALGVFLIGGLVVILCQIFLGSPNNTSSSNSDKVIIIESTEDKLRRVYDSQGIQYDEQMLREDARAVEDLANEFGR